MSLSRENNEDKDEDKDEFKVELLTTGMGLDFDIVADFDFVYSQELLTIYGFIMLPGELQIETDR